MPNSSITGCNWLGILAGTRSYFEAINIFKCLNGHLEANNGAFLKMFYHNFVLWRMQCVLCKLSHLSSCKYKLYLLYFSNCIFAFVFLLMLIMELCCATGCALEHAMCFAQTLSSVFSWFGTRWPQKHTNGRIHKSRKRKKDIFAASNCVKYIRMSLVRQGPKVQQCVFKLNFAISIAFHLPPLTPQANRHFLETICAKQWLNSWKQ